jgi:hypothetical protein
MHQALSCLWMLKGNPNPRAVATVIFTAEQLFNSIFLPNLFRVFREQDFRPVAAPDAVFRGMFNIF